MVLLEEPKKQPLCMRLPLAFGSRYMTIAAACRMDMFPVAAWAQIHSQWHTTLLNRWFFTCQNGSMLETLWGRSCGKLTSCMVKTVATIPDTAIRDKLWCGLQHLHGDRWQDTWLNLTIA